MCTIKRTYEVIGTSCTSGCTSFFCDSAKLKHTVRGPYIVYVDKHGRGHWYKLYRWTIAITSSSPHKRFIHFENEHALQW